MKIYDGLLLKRMFTDMDLLLVGDQIRQGLHAADMVKDRRYHFRSYRSCIVGKDMIDWLIKNKHCQNRKQALQGLQILQQNGMFHHVCDDHSIKDEQLFYRFRKDDGTHRENRELALFYQAQELHNGLASRTTGIMRNYNQNGEIFRNAFTGSDFVDYIVKEGDAYCREEAVIVGRKLLENDTIRHVTDDLHFRDDNKVLYQFTLDFSRHRYLYEVFQYIRRESNSQVNEGVAWDPRDCRRSPQPKPFSSVVLPSGFSPAKDSAGQSDISDAELNGNLAIGLDIPSPGTHSRNGSSGGSSIGTDSSLEPTEEITSTRSVLLRHASVEELESLDTPYVKQSIKITSDAVGFGFVIRGDSPTYVQAVDPMGPAAMAGIKVRQYVHSVNGKYVLRSDHKTVGQMIIQSGAFCEIVIMTHKRDARVSKSFN